MLRASSDDDVARLGQHAQRDLVGHDTRDDEERLFLTNQFGETSLKFVDRRVFAVAVVADDGCRHGLTHRGRWLGNRVTS